MKKALTFILLLTVFIAGGNCLEAKTTKKKATKSGYSMRFKGSIGPYDVNVNLNGYNEDYPPNPCGGLSMDLKGNYTYVKAGNSLSLKGFICYGMGLMTLEEYTKSGKHSGTWDLESDDGFQTVTGTFTNLSNQNTFDVYLRAVN